jgi:hypothetical protein
VDLLGVLGIGVGGPLVDALDSPDVEHHVVVACEVEDEVVGDAHSHPHGWSGKKTLTSTILSGDVGTPSCRKIT